MARVAKFFTSSTLELKMPEAAVTSIKKFVEEGTHKIEISIKL
jgi:hypothetical protein